MKMVGKFLNFNCLNFNCKQGTEMKTSELTGMALDWAVGKCLGWTEFDEDLQAFTQHEIDGYGWLSLDYFHPSENWSIAGPIIEREAITVSEGSPVIGIEWMACDRSSSHIQHGPSYLIAAMRCLVASKLGDEIDVPEELLK